jgi:hypothetical protein
MQTINFCFLTKRHCDNSHYDKFLRKNVTKKISPSLTLLLLIQTKPFRAFLHGRSEIGVGRFIQLYILIEDYNIF